MVLVGVSFSMEPYYNDPYNVARGYLEVTLVAILLLAILAGFLVLC